MTIDDLLIRARKMGASDVHVTVGIPPKCRVNGELVTLMEGRILPADSKALVEQMIPGRLVERFNREGEVDFSYAIKGVGRFRVNIFKQRGTMSFVILLVNTEIPSPESLGLPQSVLELVKKKRGLILVTGPTGSKRGSVIAKTDFQCQCSCEFLPCFLCLCSRIACTIIPTSTHCSTGRCGRIAVFSPGLIWFLAPRQHGSRSQGQHKYD